MEEYINIGKIDKNKLKVYGTKLKTEEVILTFERIEHVKYKHEQQYYDIEPFLKEIVENPDYILKEMQHEDTIILLKEIIYNEFKVKMIVKLATSTKDGQKNSIITFWRIRDRDYNKTLHKSEIIFKKLDNEE